MFKNIVHTSTFCHELQEVLNCFIGAGVNVKVDVSIRTGEQREEELSLEYNYSYGQDKFDVKHTISNDMWLSTYKKSSLEGRLADFLRMGYEPEVEVSIYDAFIGQEKLRLEYSSHDNTWKLVGSSIQEPVVDKQGSLKDVEEVYGPALCKDEFIRVYNKVKTEEENKTDVEDILKNIREYVKKLEAFGISKTEILDNISKILR